MKYVARTAAVSKTSRRKSLLMVWHPNLVISEPAAAGLRHSRGPFREGIGRARIWLSACVTEFGKLKILN
jgi:hypothetical protein